MILQLVGKTFKALVVEEQDHKVQQDLQEQMVLQGQQVQQAL